LRYLSNGGYVELYIIRHGQSTNNALADSQDRVCDPPLTELGRKQADILAHHLAAGARVTPWERDLDQGSGYGITQLYCSPMWRSLETAQSIERTLGLAPTVWVDIHERGGIWLDHGEAGGVVGYPGTTHSEILAAFPRFILPESITERGWWHHQGQEDRSACDGRAIRVAETMRAWAASDERIALVSHGAFIDALLKALFYQLPNHHMYYHHLNAAISWLIFRPDGHLDVEYLNRVDHIPPELVS
jgi:2,3-bisphosphoglycerate-dependent phosphoglycerate mutase